MRILAFDTATAATTVALCGLSGSGEEDPGRSLERRDDPPSGSRPRHAARLLPLVAELLEQSGTSWEAIERIAVGLGPGTFTGLRIGIATAKALARAADIPLVGVSTLHSLALNAGPATAGLPELSSASAVAAVLDARRREVFAGVWARGALEDLDEPLLSPRALTPEMLVRALESIGSALLAIGDGAIAFRERLEGPRVYVPEDASELHRVTARGHCQLAPRLPVSQPDQLHPDYQRPPDAQPRLASSVAAPGRHVG